jgi:hypothetical protein
MSQPAYSHGGSIRIKHVAGSRDFGQGLMARWVGFAPLSCIAQDPSVAPPFVFFAKGWEANLRAARLAEKLSGSLDRR